MILRPSSADKWFNCPAQPQIVERLVEPSPPTDAAMEGTCAAWLADVVLTEENIECRDLIGEVCPENNWPVDPIMANHIQKYVDLMSSRSGHFFSERRVYLNDLIHGTPDAYGITNNGILHVDDLKYGYGIVEPTSKQVLIYAAAIYLEYNKDLLSKYEPIHSIQIGIYQPRAFHVDGIYRYRTLTPGQLIAEANEIIEAGNRCTDPNAVAIPGRHCKYCEASAVCGALSTELYDVFTMLSGKANRNVTGQELSDELFFLDKAEDMLKARRTGINASALARIESGEFIPLWAKKQGMGNRKWKDDVDPVTIKTLTGVDPESGKMVTPAEMERRGVPREVIDIWTEQPPTKPKLSPISETDFKKAFGE